MNKKKVAAVLVSCAAVVACSTSDSTSRGGAIQITASGEVLALGGYAFPGGPGQEVVFVDGWDVRLEHVIVTVDNVTISENPDKVPTDQSQTDQVVAEARGPWVVDLARGGPLAGKGGGGEQAVLLTELATQNRNGGAAFEADRRYAFGYDIVPAVATAQRVNLDAAGEAAYTQMVGEGATVLYVGTATFKGTACAPASDPVLDALPREVRFRFAFRTPVSYANCQNPDNDPARGLADEEHQRGIALRPNQPAVAQITLHTDHPFWESVQHDAPLHFDPIAARAVAGVAGGPATVTLEELRAADFTALTDTQNRPLPWRSCVPDNVYTRPATAQVALDARGVSADPGAPPETALRNYSELVSYQQSTQGHLNADGLCYTRRRYPSPP